MLRVFSMKTSKEWKYRKNERKTQCFSCQHFTIFIVIFKVIYRSFTPLKGCFSTVIWYLLRTKRMPIKGQTHTLYKKNSMLLHPNDVKAGVLLLLCIPNTYQFFLVQHFATANLLSFFRTISIILLCVQVFLVGRNNEDRWKMKTAKQLTMDGPAQTQAKGWHPPFAIVPVEFLPLAHEWNMPIRI